MSAEIPGQVSEREIVEANEAVIAERDNLRQQLAASQAREAELRKCVELYADVKNWECTDWGEYHEHNEECCLDGWWVRNGSGCEPAQACLAKVDEMK